MRTILRTISIAALLIFVSLSLQFFLPAPNLFQETDFSQAVYDEHHQLLRLNLTRDQKYRLFVPLSEISQKLIDATLLQEDQYFNWHYAVNPVSIAKAAWKTYVQKSRRVGYFFCNDFWTNFLVWPSLA